MDQSTCECLDLITPNTTLAGTILVNIGVVVIVCVLLVVLYALGRRLDQNYGFKQVE
jgi:hypothetical protein